MNKRALKIVHIHSSDDGGGAEVVAYTIHKELVRLGHQSRMIVAKKQSQDDTVIEIPWKRGVPGLKRLTLKLEKYFGLQYIYSPSFRQVYRLFPKNLDVLHIHSLHGIQGYADIGALPRFSKRWPTVMSLHDMWMLTGHCAHSSGCERWKSGCGQCPDLGLFPAITRDASRLNWIRKLLVMGRSHIHTLTCSQWLASQARQSLIFNKKPIEVFNNAIDTRVFSPNDKVSSRIKLGLPTDHFIILLIANSLMNRWKGIPDGIEALNRIEASKTLPLIVGKDKKIVADRLKLTPKIMPYQSDRETLAKIYRAADVLLVPSIEETFGLVAAEAMACSTPVVAYATGGLPEVIGNNGAGILVTKRNVSGLTEALQSLIRDKQKATNMGMIAVRRASLLFDARKQAERFVALCKKIIEQRKRTSAHEG